LDISGHLGYGELSEDYFHPIAKILIITSLKSVAI
jgi:hypothetical protein